jgi:hypothetical protein
LCPASSRGSTWRPASGAWSLTPWQALVVVALPLLALPLLARRQLVRLHPAVLGVALGVAQVVPCPGVVVAVAVGRGSPCGTWLCCL